MLINEDVWLKHYGTPRHSGRYPYGSGKTPFQNGSDFLSYIDDLRKKGLTDVEIANGIGMKSTEFRTRMKIVKADLKLQEITTAEKLKAKQYSNQAIGEKMGKNESSVRALLAPAAKEKAEILFSTARMVKERVDESSGYIDIGSGAENRIGLSKEKLAAAVAILEDQGYFQTTVQVEQLGMAGNKTYTKVIAKPGSTYLDVKQNIHKLEGLDRYTEDGGNTYTGILPPVNVSSKRLGIRYAEDGGAESDGVIYVRPGVEDLSLGSNRYAQVRIAVDGTHYIKGMAVYNSDMPAGVDLLFNTNKSKAVGKLGALKPIKRQPDGEVDLVNPFGSFVRQLKDDPSDPKRVTSAMNLVNEQGDWEKWSRNLSSQMLSKQKPTLAKTQLDLTYEEHKINLDEIMALTNPSVKKKLLEAYALSADASAVHLKAAILPKTANHVILPINSLKTSEVYAPTFQDGTRVVLIRYPHGGIFEIPELTVNNKNREGRRLIGTDALDAIGIHSKVAEQLSGADFDGDTVLVIPQKKGRIEIAPPLKELIGFDAKTKYRATPGMEFKGNTQQLMGTVSNLITDMTLQGATDAELARAVKHSMVVIDAEKHNLDYKRSAIDNNIRDLKKKYQGATDAGAATLLSRRKKTTTIPARRERRASEGGRIDPKTGAVVYVDTGESWPDKKTGETVYKNQKVPALSYVSDAHTLVSKDGGTRMEKIYADHSNRMKDLANQARLASLNVKPAPYSSTARTAYAKEVASLTGKLNTALMNRPLERQAQAIASGSVAAAIRDNPDMTKEEIKKLSSMALWAARERTGAQRQQIIITDTEWHAIQSGAITPNKLKNILDKADLDRVRELATPKTKVLMSPSRVARAMAMIASGATQSEVAAALGVSVSTLSKSLKGE